MEDARYKAFISYSHKDDKWATWVHRSLEAYKPPKRLVGKETAHGRVPKRLAPVFRDRDELPTATDLGSVINEALRESATQIVICSPAAARSKWVNEEILAYKRLGRADRIFCLIVDGEPNASDLPGSETLECFPPALRYRLGADGKLGDERAEPIAADAREDKDGKSNAKLKLIAGMLGVGFDSLKQRELHRRQRRLMAIAGASLVGMVVTSGLAVMAVLARSEAEAQRARAEAEAETARQTTNFLVDIFEVSNPSEALGNSITAREILDRGVRRIEFDLQDQPAIQSTLLDTMGTVYKSLGLYSDARILLERGLTTRRTVYGDVHAEVARSEANLASVIGLQAEFEEAATLYENAIAQLREAPGADPTQLPATLVGLATIRRNQGDTESAERLYREAIGIQRPTPDAESLDLARSLDQLGVLLAGLARSDEAEPLLRESLAMRRRLLPVDVHPDLDQGLNNLGFFLYEAGEYEETERLFRESVTINEQLLGENHPDLAFPLSNLSIVLTDTGKLPEAVSFAERALRIRIAALGEQHPLTGQSLMMLGSFYYDSGDAEAALDHSRRALDAFRSAYPGDHADVALGLQNFATLLLQEGDYTTAEPLMREALEMNRRVLPAEHPDIAISQSGLAMLLLETERPQEALEMATPAAELLAASFGNDYWRTAWARVLEGASQSALGRYAEAEPLLVEGYETITATGGRRFNLDTTLRYIVSLYEAWGRPEAALRYSNLRTQL